MHILSKIFLSFSLTLCASQVALASFYQFASPTTGYVNYLEPALNEIFFLSQDGSAFWFRQSQLKAAEKFQVAERCKSLTQNTVAMSTGEGGLTLAYPFLVGVDRVCLIDENKKNVSLVTELSHRLPQNVFAASFAGRKEQLYYFLINGREFPSAKSGYLQLLTINSVTLQFEIRELFHDVPDFSGALLYDRENIWVTTYPGKIYKIPTAALHSLIDSARTMAFLSLALLESRTTADLNAYMLKGQNYFLFYNENYPSYLVHHSNKAQTPVELSCEPLLNFSPAGRNQWLTLCDRRDLRLQNLR